MDILTRCISSDGSLMVMAADTTDAIEKAREIHNTSKVCSAALGRLLTASAMMGSMLKGEGDSLTLKINGGGPIGSIIAVSDGSCGIKGYCVNSNVELPLNNKGKLDVGKAVGKNGFLTVIKDLGLSEPYIGRVPIVSGEIAEDITSYFAISEQTPSVCGLGVLCAKDKSIIKAGGFLIELLPGCSQEAIDKVENDIRGIDSVTKMLTDGLSPYEMCLKLLPSFKIEKLEEFYPKYRCDCSKERVINALTAAGKSELKDMSKDENTEVKCQFCNKVYNFSSDEILDIASRI